MSIEEIISKIESEECFECSSEGMGFFIRIESYVPWLATAIHDGSGFRDELQDISLISRSQRWYEEDPCTGDMVSEAPIFLKGLDSRFEYDLNRAPENAVYDTAWGEKCWKEPLSKEQKSISLQKHSNYYRVLGALLRKLESKFERVVLHDMHSYNWKRHNRIVPEFNLGIELIDKEKWKEEIGEWFKLLSDIEIPRNTNTTAINDVFWGRGYQLANTVSKFKRTLVLATEMSKIYCDELTGEVFQDIVKSISKQLGFAMKVHAEKYFTHRKVSEL